MLTKIIIDPGHGGGEPGAVGNGLKEKDVNLELALMLRDYLSKKYECTIRLTREEDVALSLLARTNLANSWRADFFLSLHVNGWKNADASGYEDYVHPSASAVTTEMQKVFHPIVAKVWTDAGRKDRGMKAKNLHVLRETRMPAMLVENGFITNPRDAELLKKADFKKKLVEAMGEACAKALKLVEKKEVAESQPEGELFYRVVTGSFKDRKNAERRVEELKRAGFASFIMTYRK